MSARARISCNVQSFSRTPSRKTSTKRSWHFRDRPIPISPDLKFQASGDSGGSGIAERVIPLDCWAPRNVPMDFIGPVFPSFDSQGAHYPIASSIGGINCLRNTMLQEFHVKFHGHMMNAISFWDISCWGISRFRADPINAARTL